MTDRAGGDPPAEAAERPPPCVVCGRAGRVATTAFHMTHGVTVWLCPPHRTTDYLARRAGRTFAERLDRAWRAAGALTRRREAALATHRRRVRPEPPIRTRPGSYSWPELRAEAETRFAAGQDPQHVIRELRRRYAAGPARPPSVRTLRRWHLDARWLATAPAAAASPRPGWPRRPRRSDWPELNWHWAPHPLGLLTLVWADDLTPKGVRWRRE
jgi:hypothetical protein